ncbi:MAG: GFA family protein [Aliiglaciecola sp.]|uniref:GFA family protein n=1 Tax=Aliiglaciecola sp. TaxID=1872441 RepID=UPI00329856C9
MPQEIKGSCLCGAVTCEVHGPYKRFYQCHCDRCQKKTGSAFASLLFTDPENIKWLSGEDKIKRFDLPNAVRFSNVFCTECGSQVPYLTRDGSLLCIPAGFLDEVPDMTPQANIFWEEKFAWYDAGQAAPKFSQYPE